MTHEIDPIEQSEIQRRMQKERLEKQLARTNGITPAAMCVSVLGLGSTFVVNATDILHDNDKLLLLCIASTLLSAGIACWNEVRRNRIKSNIMHTYVSDER